ncbi:Transcriptional regulator, TetR family [Caenispirillum salinarum AK4]|uniref:Transcriptional regulator, TetR family n=1 Tax=Caenispirillum salinarum AK4 TaxID=1238182 RepID=K9GUE8_9PROT|nr:TetR/AcrR family transcriptional regulator [Caenispirillum salinarum]EKV28379.1 Transcriptional regulator, TetR family [Caenispirillum salinarum AK4]
MERVLAACWRLLERGPGMQVRMSDIAREAGISRQALYLHFPNRAELLIATTRFIDARSGVAARLAASRAATGGIERLEAYIEAWGGYIPTIYGVGRALMAMADTDEAARAAWADRMAAMREGCAAAVAALAWDGVLDPSLDEVRATDVLWTLLSVRTWEHLVRDCGWSQDAYVADMKRLGRRALVTGEGG